MFWTDTSSLNRLAMKKYLVVMIMASFVSATNASKTNLPTEPAAVQIKAAVEEFKSLSKKERKSRVKEAKNHLRQVKKVKKSGKEAHVDQVVLIILAILLPPLAVYLHQDDFNDKFWISVLLTLLFWIPGVIYALLVVLGEV